MLKIGECSLGCQQSLAMDRLKKVGHSVISHAALPSICRSPAYLRTPITCGGGLRGKSESLLLNGPVSVNELSVVLNPELTGSTMFSPFSSFSNPFSLPRILGGNPGIAIDIKSVGIHDVETQQEKRARTLKHLLKLNHTNHSIVYHNLQFHNHTPHVSRSLPV